MRVLAGMMAVACVASVAFAQEKDVHVLVAEANQAFADGNYVAALESYTVAGETLPESPELAYNQGVAYYKLGDYRRARDALNRSLLTYDVKLEAKIKFNLGNVAYALARQEISNPAEALGLLQTAIQRYRDAVELDPEDEGAHINIELAQRLIKELLDQLAGQRQGRRSRGNDEQEPQGDDEREQRGDGQGQPPGGQEGGQEQAGAERQERLQQQTGDRMTPQEVEQLLQAVRDKDQRRRKEIARRRNLQRAPVVRDW